MKLILILFLGAFALSSCLKEELPVPKKEPGDVLTNKVNIGGNYAYQAYFDLSANQLTGINNKELWDVAFESGINGSRVITNTSRNMMVYTTDKSNLTDLTSEEGYINNPNFDSATGNLDSTGIGNWQDGLVRILDMGYSSSGTPLGWCKLKITNVTPSSYTFEYASIESTSVSIVTINKRDEYNFSYFSLLNQTEVEASPKTENWDIVFTQYIHQFYEPVETPYLVTGCITNRINTKVGVITELNFENINYDYASSITLSENANTIGFSWKTLVGSDYEINTDITYIIQDHEENVYKLRFIDFYSETGEKGNPTWEFQKL